MELFKEDAKSIPLLLVGYIILALGIYLTKLSLLGMSSWSVLHDGLTNVSGLTFGRVTQLLGLVIMVLSIFFLKTKIGIETILNVVLVGFFIDFFEFLYPVAPDDILIKSIILLFGILFTTFGRSLYITSKLGPGPRDGLFVGLARITKIDVKYIKPSIELTVLLIGVLLGGKFGIGTIIITFVSGYMVQFFFRILKFDPKAEKQSDILNYIRIQKI